MSDEGTTLHWEAIIMQFAHQELQNNETSRRSRTRFVLIAVSCIGALVIVNAQLLRADADALDVPASNTAPPISPSAVFQYFPAQYRNSAQSGPVEEHIQAF